MFIYIVDHKSPFVFFRTKRQFFSLVYFFTSPIVFREAFYLIYFILRSLQPLQRSGNNHLTRYFTRGHQSLLDSPVVSFLQAHFLCILKRAIYVRMV